VPMPGRMVTVGLSPVTCQRRVAVEPRSMVGAELVNETMTGGCATGGGKTGSATLTVGLSAGVGETGRDTTGGVDLAAGFSRGDGETRGVTTGGVDLAAGFSTGDG